MKYSRIMMCAFPLIFSMSFLSAQQAVELPSGITDALRGGNSSSLSAFFNTSLQLTLPSSQDAIYTRQQAELIIRDFFTKHVPTGFSVLHKGGSAESQYAIGILATDGGSYRVTLLIKPKDNKPFIHQIRFEQENAD